MLRNCQDCGIEFDARPTGRGVPRKRCPDCTVVFAAARANATAMRARARESGDLDAELIFSLDVFQRDNWVCHLCGDLIPEESRRANRMHVGEFDPLAPTIDHIIPRSLGGKHTMGNVATAHHKCNQSKNNVVDRKKSAPTNRAAREAVVPFRKCGIHGCGQPLRRQNMCTSHAYRSDRYGNPLIGMCCCGCGELVDVPADNYGPIKLPNHSVRRKGPAPTAQQQLQIHVRHEPVSDHGKSIGLTDGCHIWTKAVNAGGYGTMHDTYTGRRALAHRFAYILAHGDDAVEEKVVDHLCRVRACVNVNHLEAVTNQENVLRGHAVNTPAPSWHERSHGHPFISDPAVEETAKNRRCLTCWEASQEKLAARTLCPAGLHRWPESRGSRDCRLCGRERFRAKHREQHGHDFVEDESFDGKKARCLTCHIKRQEQRTHCPHGHSFAEHGTTTQGGCAECNRIRARNARKTLTMRQPTEGAQ